MLAAWASRERRMSATKEKRMLAAWKSARKSGLLGARGSAEGARKAGRPISSTMVASANMLWRVGFRDRTEAAREATSISM